MLTISMLICVLSSCRFSGKGDTESDSLDREDTSQTTNDQLTQSDEPQTNPSTPSTEEGDWICRPESQQPVAGNKLQESEDADLSWGPIQQGSSSYTYDLKENMDYIKIYGRSETVSVGIACDHIASGIEFNADVVGTIKLKANSNAKLFYAVYIDGVLQDYRLQLEAGTNEYVVAKSLPKGVHNIKLINQTGVAFGRSELISISMLGILKDAPADAEYLIEFVGDSITSGYGLADTSARPDHFDSTKSYAYQTAQLLHADHSMVAVTGWAILPADANDPIKGCVPAIYDKYCPWGRGDVAYEPERCADVVVINLGTNDINTRENYDTDFVDAAIEFALKVRQTHGNIPVIWAYGQMITGDALTVLEGKLGAIMDALGGEQNGYYTVKLMYDQNGLHGHPSVEAEKQSAQILTDFILGKNLLK